MRRGPEQNEELGGQQQNTVLARQTPDGSTFQDRRGVPLPHASPQQRALAGTPHAVVLPTMIHASSPQSISNCFSGPSGALQSLPSPGFPGQHEYQQQQQQQQHQQRPPVHPQHCATKVMVTSHAASPPTGLTLSEHLSMPSTPPPASQVPPQADSLFMLLKVDTTPAYITNMPSLCTRLFLSFYHVRVFFYYFFYFTFHLRLRLSKIASHVYTTLSYLLLLTHPPSRRPTARSGIVGTICHLSLNFISLRSAIQSCGRAC